MSNVRQFPDRRDKCVEEAGKWVARMGDGLSHDEEMALAKWLSKSRRNYEEFMELARLWDSMDSLTRLADICPEPPQTRVAMGTGVKWLVAASVLLVFSVLFMTGKYDISDQDAQTQTIVAAEPVIDYETTIGEQGTYTLSDGTEIVLNTNSRALVSYTPSNRLITLLQGEMHVSVAHDSSRPLSVIVGDRIVQAVGTEFNLEITEDQVIELIVSEGVVIVGVLDSPVDNTANKTPIILTPSSTLVAAGQEVSIGAGDFNPEEIEAEVIESDEIAIRLSWRDGNIIFQGESLEEAISEVERYTSMQFVFLDEDAKKVRVAGMFKAGDVEGLLATLRGHFNIAYEWQGDDKILLSAQE